MNAGLGCASSARAACNDSGRRLRRRQSRAHRRSMNNVQTRNAAWNSNEPCSRLRRKLAPVLPLFRLRWWRALSGQCLEILRVALSEGISAGGKAYWQSARARRGALIPHCPDTRLTMVPCYISLISAVMAMTPGRDYAQQSRTILSLTHSPSSNIYLGAEDQSRDRTTKGGAKDC
jgi:hypothetical protein